MLLAIILLTVCVLFAGALLTGWCLAKRGRLDTSQMIESRRAFTDLVTRRFQRWCEAHRMEAIRQQRWSACGC
jgi:hypothetical protein